MKERIPYWRVGIGFLMTFLVMLADLTVNTLNQSLLFNRLGIDYVGPMNFVKAASVIIASAAITHFSGERKNRNLLIIFLLGVVGIGLIASHWIQVNVVAAVFLTISAEGMLMVGFNFLLWSLLSEIFPVLMQKRYFPLIAAGYGVAGIVGGVEIAGSLQKFQVPTLAQIFSAEVALTAVLAFLLGLGIQKPAQNPAEKKREESFFQNITEFSQFSAKIPFLNPLFAYILFSWILFRLYDFQFCMTLKQVAGSEVQFGTWLAYFYSTVHSIVVIYQMLFAQRMLVSQGLTRLMLFFPVTLSITSFVCLFMSPTWMIVLNRGLVEIFLLTIVFGVVAITYNIAPSDLRSRAQAIVGGFGSSIGGISGAGLVYILSKLNHSQSELLTQVFLFVSSICCLGYAIRSGRTYIETAMKNLESNTQEIFVNSLQALQERGHKNAIRKLLQVATNRSGVHDPEIVILASEALAQLKNPELVGRILNKVEGNNPTEIFPALRILRTYYISEMKRDVLLKHRMRKSLERVLITSAKSDDISAMVYSSAVRLYFKVAREDDIPTFLEQTLSNQDNRVISNTLEELPQLGSKYSYLYIDRFLSHPNHRVRSTAIVELWKIYDEKETLIQALEEMLKSQDAMHLIAGIWAIGQTRADELLQFLFPLLNKDLPAPVRHHLDYALLHYPLKTLKKQAGFTLEMIHSAVRRTFDEMTDLDHMASARRSSWHASFAHPSHLRAFEKLILESTPERVDFLYETLLQFSSDQRNLLKLVEKYQGSSRAAKSRPDSPVIQTAPLGLNEA